MRASSLLFVLAGCTPVETHDRSVVADVLAVRIELDAGNVTVRPGVLTRVDRIARGDVQVETRLEDGILRIEGHCATVFPCSLDLTVDLPPGVPVDVHVGAGDVHFTGLDADVSVEVDSGDIRAFDLSSPGFYAQAGWGDARVEFAEAPSDVSIGVGVGDVVLTLPDIGYSLDVACLGLRRIAVAEAPDGPPVRARTASGSVEVRAAVRTVVERIVP